jgi:hypothetical protein
MRLWGHPPLGASQALPGATLPGLSTRAGVGWQGQQWELILGLWG